MTLVLTLLVLAVVVAVAAVATGRITGGLDPLVSSLPGRPLPDGEIRPEDVERVRFSPALRGYRMEEVDAVLDRLVAALAERDETIARLRAPAGHPASLEHPAHARPPYEPPYDEPTRYEPPPSAQPAEELGDLHPPAYGPPAYGPPAYEPRREH